jgi:HK97 family phage portal protein
MRNPFRRMDDRAGQPAAYGESNVQEEDGTRYGPRSAATLARLKAASGAGTETRSISLPWSTGSPVLDTAVDQEAALTLAALYSATDLLSTCVATLPIKGYRKVGQDRICMPTLPALFDRLVGSGQIVTWWRRCMTSLLLRGNAYGLILARDRFGYPTQIEWLSPDHVAVLDRMVSGRGSYLHPVWTYLGQEIPTESLVHIPWYVVPERVQGLSPVRAFAATIGVGLSAQSYGTDWFNSGGFPPGKFKNSEAEITTDEAAIISNRLMAAMRARRPLVYGKDWEYEPVTVPPEEAQFIETMHLTATQIAAIFHVPAEWIGGQTGSKGLHYSTAEQDMIHMVTLGVRPYIELLESVFFGLLPEKQYVRFNLDSLVRADLKTRHEVYEIDAHIGLRTVNEMRAQEDWEPLPEPPEPLEPPAEPAPSTVEPGDSTVDPAQTDPTPPAPAPSGASLNGSSPRLLLPSGVRWSVPS